MDPSGRQVEIADGDQRATIVEVGGGLRTYSVGGVDVLDGYEADRMCSAGRGQVLIPWPNRLEDGNYEFDGRTNQLPLSEPGTHNAIHGLVRWVSWSVVADGPSRAVAAHVLHPQPGYPYTLALKIEYSLSKGGLRVETTATNIGRSACPYGSGHHPYLTAGTAIDEVELRLPARTVIRSDERGRPVVSLPVDGTEYDFREARPIGSTVLDTAFTDLERDDDGLARIAFGNLTLWLDQAYRYVMIFSGDSIPDVARRSLAVEPMTCPANAFRTGESLISLRPAESFTSVWGLTPARP